MSNTQFKSKNKMGHLMNLAALGRAKKKQMKLAKKSQTNAATIARMSKHYKQQKQTLNYNINVHMNDIEEKNVSITTQKKQIKNLKKENQILKMQLGIKIKLLKKQSTREKQQQLDIFDHLNKLVKIVNNEHIGANKRAKKWNDIIQIYDKCRNLLQQRGEIHHKISQLRKSNKKLGDRAKRQHVKEILDLIDWKTKHNSRNYNYLITEIIYKNRNIANNYFKNKLTMSAEQTAQFESEGQYSNKQIRHFRRVMKNLMGHNVFKQYSDTERAKNDVLPQTGDILDVRTHCTSASMKAHKNSDNYRISPVFVADEAVLLGALFNAKIKRNNFKLSPIYNNKIFAFWGGDKCAGGYTESVSADICKNSNGKYNSMHSLLTNHNVRDSAENLKTIYDASGKTDHINQLLLYPVCIMISVTATRNNILKSRKTESIILVLNRQAQEFWDHNWSKNFDETDMIVPTECKLNDDEQSMIYKSLFVIIFFCNIIVTSQLFK